MAVDGTDEFGKSATMRTRDAAGPLSARTKELDGDGQNARDTGLAYYCAVNVLGTVIID